MASEKGIRNSLHFSIQILVLLLACFCLTSCDAIDTITITQPLKDPETIVSSGQSFKLGFFSPANSSNRYVGIMFNIPVMGVIWVANRDNPLSDSAGTVTISEDGNIVVLNGRKQILWSSNASDPETNSSAQLLDAGNLVLRDNSNGRILWDSFQNPTDCLVRGMRLSAAGRTNEKMRLRSWRSPSDPSVGNFSATLSQDSLPTAQFLILNHDKSYWRSGPWNGNTFIGAPARSAAVYVSGYSVANDDTGTAYFTYTYSIGYSVYYVLDSSGVLWEKYWTDGSQDWKVSWWSLQYECEVYGKCGPFGICNPRDSTCTCLQGFEPRDREEWNRGNWTGGCVRRNLLQCQRNRSDDEEGKKDGFFRLKRMKVPDFAEWKAASEENCSSHCLDNCSCIAYTYSRGVGCMHWYGSLIDIQQFSSDGVDLYVRVAYSELDNDKNIPVFIIASIVVGGFLVLAVSAYISLKMFTKFTGRQQENEMSLFRALEVQQMTNMPMKKFKKATLEELPLYSYKTLANATDGFHYANKLGKGGFGQVYMGKLLAGRQIAVKRLSKSSGQGIEEFMNEVLVISKLQHRNLVRLLGCCIERDEKMLVYEYMPNKSLDAYLFDVLKQDVLDWSKRTILIDGIARGLLYLHRDSRLKIIHRDLKASNILLDEELNPKISDFGLARIFKGNQEQANTRRVVGTYGYMAPEYVIFGRFSEKSDVYSFGVLLLEIISGRRNTSFCHDEHEASLVEHAWKLWNDHETLKLIDPAVTDKQHIEKEVLRYVHVGLLCVQECAKDRPNISAVLSMLNSAVAEHPPPKFPAFTGRIVSSEIESSQPSLHSVNTLSVTIVEPR